MPLALGLCHLGCVTTGEPLRDATSFLVHFRDGSMCRRLDGVAAELDGASLLAPTREHGSVHAARILGYWLICAGTLGTQYGFGALFVQFLELLHSDRGATALVGSLCLGIQCIVAPFASGLAAKFGERRIICSGAAMLAVGLSLSSFATSIWHLMLTYSLMGGLGMALSLFPAIMVANAVFEKTMARVHALANTGAMVGTLVLGPMTPVMFEQFGLRGALLTLAACVTTLVLAGALLLVPTPRRAAAGDVSSWSTTRRLLVEPRVLLLGSMTMIVGLGSWVPIVHIVRLALDRGHSEETASHLLMFVAVGNGAGRLPTATLADTLGRRRTYCATSAVYALFMLSAALPSAYSSSRAGLAVFAAAAGALAGGLNTVMPTLVSEVLPAGDRAAATPLVISPIGIGFVLGPALAGSLHEYSGDYTLSLLCATACLATASLLCGLSLCIHGREKGPQQTETRKVEASGCEAQRQGSGGAPHGVDVIIETEMKTVQLNIR